MWNFAIRKTAEPRLVHRPAAGMRVYAIGDIHGRFDLFDEARQFIEADVAERRPERPFAVFLGDLIDRGPDSASVVDALARADIPVPFVVLRGNHEQMLLEGLVEDRPLETWLRNGGLATLTSYGIPFDSVANLDELRDLMRNQLPAEHLAFLAGLGTSAVSGDYFFCHAGVRPDVPLDAQVDADLLWIRKPFLESKKYHGKMVVHGHTPVSVPELLPNRLGIDTGAYATGNLTCLILEDEEVVPYSVQLRPGVA